ncbi:MAG TPA: DNA recombination protein RmuC [Steroidobacteraceae bacterium]|jgi:DNA recombination protein RmuC|nr:DNA recombination protein RmuC [Steroidobacteraceae bacterium]
MISEFDLILIGAALLVGVALGFLGAQLLAGRRREERLSQLVAPLQAALEATRTQAQRLDAEHRDSEANLRGQIVQLVRGQTGLERETRNLVTALRRPEVRGRWGELTLRRVVELAGLVQHCDFTEQVHVSGTNGAARPDLIVHLPDGRDVVIDAKAPLDAYLAALEATDDAGQRQHLQRHAQQVAARVRELAAKAYWAQFPRAPEFVILFIPSDQFLSAALAVQPELIEQALAESVVLATPSTLMAVLKCVAFCWRQDQVASNARQIQELGGELHARLATFLAHLAKVGQRLGGAVEAFNAAAGSLQRQVVPQARRLRDLGATADAPLEAPASLDDTPKDLK